MVLESKLLIGPPLSLWASENFNTIDNSCAFCKSKWSFWFKVLGQYRFPLFSCFYGNGRRSRNIVRSSLSDKFVLIAQTNVMIWQLGFHCRDKSLEGTSSIVTWSFLMPWSLSGIQSSSLASWKRRAESSHCSMSLGKSWETRMGRHFAKQGELWMGECFSFFSHVLHPIFSFDWPYVMGVNTFKGQLRLNFQVKVRKIIFSTNPSAHWGVPKYNSWQTLL